MKNKVKVATPAGGVTALLVCALMALAAPVADAQMPNLGGLGAAFGKKDKSSNADPANAAAPAGANPVAGVFGAVADMTKQESPEEEIEVGRGVAVRMLGALKPVKNPKLQEYVGKVGMTIVAQGDRKDLPWRFVVADSPSVNAFAVPGGIVIITKGLYDLLETEDELAAVLGHEVAHVQRKHHFNVVKQQKLVGSVTSAVGSEVAKDNALIAGFVSRATEVMARGLDKSAEYEADRDGVVLAARAGYDSIAMLAVLDKLAAGAGGGKDASLLFSTHPSPADRISSLTASLTPQLEEFALPSAAAARLKTVPAK